MNPDKTTSDTAYFAAIAMLTIGTAFVFGPVLTHKFIALDYETYTGNPEIQRGLSWDGLRYAFTTVVASNWHPVTVLGHMTLHTLFGPAPPAHYAANLALHWLNVLLVFEVLRRSTGALWRSALVAALFGLHPFRVESIAWTAELKDVLSGAFMLLAILAYLRFVRTRRPLDYAVLAGLFVFALLSKASVVAFPFLLLLFDRWPLDRIHFGHVKRVALEKLPLVLLAVGMSAITLFTFSDTTLKSTTALSFSTRLAMACIAYKDYLVTTVWPAHLSPHYPYTSATAPPLETASSILLLAAITTFTVVQRRRHPYLLVGWLWFILAIGPVSGVLPVGSHFRADRYTYVAHIGLFTAIVWYGAALAADRARLRPAATATATSIVIVLAATSFVDVHRWRDNVTLFGYAVEQTPQSSLVHTGLAIGLIQQRRLDEAEPHLREALRINPGDLGARRRLAALLLLTDRPEESADAYQSLIEVDPDNIANYIGLAVALERSGDTAGADAAVNAALEMDPANPAALEIRARLEQRGSV